jgi:hypothetical protein
VLTKTPGKLPGASFSLARPDIGHVIVLRDPANKGKMIGVRELQANVPKLGLMLRVIGVRNGKDIEHAFSAVGATRLSRVCLLLRRRRADSPVYPLIMRALAIAPKDNTPDVNFG